MAIHSNKSWEAAYFLKISNIDDVPVNGVTDAPISSNWAFTHDDANTHIDHSALNLIAGSGLTGGGTIDADVTFNIGAGAGITVGANDISVTFSGTGVATTVSRSDHNHDTDYNNYTHPNHSGQVTSVGDGATALTISAITAQPAMTTDAVGTDEFLFNNGGVLERMAVSKLNTYFNGSLNFNNYTHPSHPGDDIAVDMTPLTGAEVVSDINITVTTDLEGHVTGASASTATRNLTPSDIGAQATSEKSQANGYASLDGSGKVPTAELPASVLGALYYSGTWDASTNTPTLTSGSGNQGDYYVVSVDGTTNLDGITDWKIGDWVVFNGTAWEKIDNTDSVTSVNTKTGAVVLTTTDIGEGSNLYHTTERVEDVVGGQFVTVGTHTGLTASYDDAGDGAIDLALTYAGSGSATTVSRSDHNHTGTYEPVDATILRQSDVDDVAVNGQTVAPISSNWAYDHANDPTAHGTQPWSIKTTNYTAVDGDRLVVDTAGGAITITLPLNPAQNETIRIKTTTSYTNNVTISRNGSNILSTADDYILDGDYLDITLLYVDATIGWLV
jgi:hypothetical protein